MPAKNTANSTSSTMTRKIAFTTDDVENRPHPRRRGSLAQRLRAALHLEALDGGDQADHDRHERSLVHPDLEGIEVDDLAQPVDEGLRRHPAIEPGHYPA